MYALNSDGVLRLPDGRRAIKASKVHYPFVAHRGTQGVVHMLAEVYLRWGGVWGKPHLTYAKLCGNNQPTPSEAYLLAYVPAGMRLCITCRKRLRREAGQYL